MIDPPAVIILMTVDWIYWRTMNVDFFIFFTLHIFTHYIIMMFNRKMYFTKIKMFQFKDTSN